MEIFKKSIEFDWDKGNKEKNLIKHGVSNEECEEIFFDPHKRVVAPGTYSGPEERHILIGETKRNRLLMVIFTMRNQKVRVISARDLNRKEKGLYEKTT